MNLLKSILSLLLPETCPVCGMSGNIECGICKDCLKEWNEETLVCCPVCGHDIRRCVCGCGFTRHTGTIIGSRPFISLTFYLGSGKGDGRVTEKMLFALKDNGELSDFFAFRIANAVKYVFADAKVPLEGWIITYPPRSAENRKARGFDQCGEITSKIGKILNLEVRETFTRLSGEEAKTLGRDERLTLAEETLVPIKENIKDGGKYILFDDIITSGATVETAARHLRFYGAAEVFPVSIARTAASAAPGRK